MILDIIIAGLAGIAVGAAIIIVALFIDTPSPGPDC